MKRQLTAAAVEDYTVAPPAVQKAFDKKVKLLLENFRHPSLRAKKYVDSERSRGPRKDFMFAHGYPLEGSHSQ
jgi:hypothetical protein